MFLQTLLENLQSIENSKIKSQKFLRKYSFDNSEPISNLNQKIKKSSSNKKLSKINSNNSNSKKLIKFFAEQITFKYENKKNKFDSFFSLANSNLFTIHLILYYLDNKNEESVLDFLINLLYQKYNKNSYKFLPQLLSIYFSKNKKNFSFEKYFFVNCLNNIYFCMKFYYLIMSVYNKVYNRDLIEYLIIKFRLIRIKKRRENLIDMKLFKSNENIKYFILYFKKCLIFYRMIENFAFKIEEKEHYYLNHFEKIKEEFNKLIEKLNKKITALYKISNELKRINNNNNIIIEPYFKNLFRGIMLFSTNEENDDNNNNNLFDVNDKNIIVKVLEKYSSINIDINNNGKKYIKILFTFECIKINNCEKWDEIMLNNNNNNNNNNENNNNNNNENKIEDLQSKNNINENNNNNNINKNDLMDVNNKSLICNPFENINEKIEYSKEHSQFKNFKDYSLKSFILDYNRDNYGEIIINQLINEYNKIFSQNNSLPFYIHPKTILILSPLVSLTEDISTSNNSFKSIEKINEDIKGKYKTFNNFFLNYFLNNFEEAQRNFTESLASYLLFSYLINNNINIYEKCLLNNSGFVALKLNGYSMSSNNNNCKNIFKLPMNFLEILDGKNSSMFNYFKSIISKGIIEIKKFYENFEILIKIIVKSCQIEDWSNRDKFYIIESLKERFHLVNNEIDIIKDVDLLFEKAFEKKGFFSNMFNK